jgi:Ser/Thr protein kinase RdoA (MazF antagonist)
MKTDVQIPSFRDDPFVARLARDLADTFTVVEKDEARDIVLRFFGIAGDATRFSTEKDDTFRIDTTDGKRYVLKVSNPGESVEELDLQVAAMRHIARVAPHLPVPRVIDSIDERAIVNIVTQADERRTARLYSYVEGQPLDTLKTTPAERYQIGEVLAELRLAMASFSHAAQHRELAWDVKHFEKLSPLIDCVQEAAHRKLLEKAFLRYALIVDDLSKFHCQVVHNDFNRSNIVSSRGGPNFVAGIIDFGDTVHTAIAIDVGTAVMNQFPLDFDPTKDRDLFSDSRDLLRGYLAHAALDDNELRLIPHLATARVAARALLTTWRATLFPHNAPYILRFTGPGWVHLDWLMKQDHDALSTALLAAA